jgi:hypothetical protein
MAACLVFRTLEVIATRLKLTREAMGHSQAKWCKLIGVTP